MNINSGITRIIVTAILSCSCSHVLYAQAIDWKLKRDEEGIKVYTASTENSNFKSVKVTCNVTTRLSQLVAFLLDVDAQHSWVYGNKNSRLIKRPAPNEIVFYSEVSVPWPCTNRDYIAHITINQVTPQLVNIDSHSEPDLIPRVEGMVRVVSSIAHWEVTALSKDQVQIVYTVSFDPGGTVPPWLINLFITKGPFQTFQKLREEVSKPAYQNAHLDFIKDLI